MIKDTFKKIILAASIFCLPFAAGAWGLEGHRIVGQIADSYLTKKAKKEIAKILGPESMAMVSNWADFIKSDPGYGYLYNWHFINLKSGQTMDQLQSYLEKDTVTDAYTKINFLVLELKKPSLSQPDKLLYLRMLIHLVGDIHQPMHTGRREDQGGEIKVMWFNEPKNLHQVWDDQLILFQQLSYTEYSVAINHATPAQLNEWQQEPVSTWVIQSYQIAEKIYSEITQPDQRLDYKYNFTYLSILNQQLLKGGVHLAAILNEIFR